MRPMRGILYKLCAVMAFIVMASLIKAVSDHVPPGEVVFFRSLLALPVIFIWLLIRGELRTGLRVISPLSHILRGVVGTVAMGMGFAGLAYLPLPEVTALGYAAPLLTVVFAAMFLNEKVGIYRMSAVALGMVGVLIVLSPRLTIVPGSGDDTATLGAIVVLVGAVFAALAQVFIRKMVLTEKTTAIVFYFSLTATVLSLVTLPFGWVIPTAPEFALLITAGLLGGVGQIFLTSSYREADASLVAPFDYASMIFALIIGYWAFDEVPTATMLYGAALVILAGVLIIWRERMLGLERSRQRKSMTPQG